MVGDSRFELETTSILARQLPLTLVSVTDDESVLTGITR